MNFVYRRHYTLPMIAALMGGCLAPPNVAQPVAHRLDPQLFEQVLEAIDSAAGGDPVHADPRPLVPSPDLVTLHSVGGIIPERLRAAGHGASLLEDDQVLTKRRSVLARIGYLETDAFNDLRCPGALVPQSDQALERRKRNCPSEAYVSVIMSVPRQGGAYWPANVDERGKYSGNIYSVRAIERSVSPDGSVEVSADYVFSCDGSYCRVVERRALLIVE